MQDEDPIAARAQRSRVCVIGSGWAFTSGISYYTCRLTTALASEVDVSAILMRRLIPRRFYPGRDRVGVRVNQIEYPPQIPVYDGVDWYWGITIIRAIRHLRRQRPDVVVLQWWTGAVLHSLLVLSLVARRLGAKVIIEFHETQDTGEARVSGAAKYMDAVGSRLVRGASGFVVHSDFDRAAVAHRYPIGDRPVRVAPHGPYDHHTTADTAAAKVPSRAEIAGGGGAPDQTIVLFFGTIRPYKGLEVLVEAFHSLDADEVAPLRLVIVGETWESWGHSVEAARAGRNSDRVTIVNRYVDDAEVSAFFELADVVALPYTRSSASGPLHVAMAYGLPTILSDVGGLRQGADGYAGVEWVQPGDVGSLRAALLKAPSLKGQRFDDPRSWKETVEVFQSLFEALVSTGS